jgi:RNA polymerase sigma factor for flagellar operon FliA
MIRSARPYLEMDDLISIGAEALLRASERFDPDRKVSFGSFAYLRVRGAMVEGIGRVGPHTRGCVRRRANRPEPTPRPMPCSYEDGRHASASRSELTESLHAAIETRRLAGRIGAALDALAPNERALIERHYLRGESLLEVARDLHISKSWASRLHARALESIRNSLEPAPQVQ